MENNIEVNIFDLSSTEPHIMLNCPFCEKVWQKKVEEAEFETPCKCKIKYRLAKRKDGAIDVSFFKP